MIFLIKQILKVQQLHIQVGILKLSPCKKIQIYLLNMVIKITTTLQNLSNNLNFGPPILASNLLPFFTNFELATS